MEWNELRDESQLLEILDTSPENRVLIYKHSTRCSTSRLMLDRLERNWNLQEMEKIRPYFLDLIAYREISDFLAKSLGIPHESPQAIMVFAGKAVDDWSHFEIDYQRIKEIVKN